MSTPDTPSSRPLPRKEDPNRYLYTSGLFAGVIFGLGYLVALIASLFTGEVTLAGVVVTMVIIGAAWTGIVGRRRLWRRGSALASVWPTRSLAPPAPAGQGVSDIGMVSGMATRKYTVTLPEELAEEIRGEVGVGNFSAYVTRAIERQREQDRLGELVTWMQEEGGPLTEAERVEAEAELRDHARYFAERDAGAGRDAGSGRGGHPQLPKAG